MLVHLAEAIEARDPYTRGHSERVTRLAEDVARWLGWSDERVAVLELGGALHDIGKLGVPAHVLRKPGTLTPEELAQVRRHPATGAQMLAPIEEVHAAVPCVLYHHERWDGGGYPSGRAGREIPVEARLLAIVDAFDAMTSDRPYRTAVSAELALAEVERCAGTQFDPTLVAAFVEVLTLETAISRR